RAVRSELPRLGASSLGTAAQGPRPGPTVALLPPSSRPAIGTTTSPAWLASTGKGGKPGARQPRWVQCDRTDDRRGLSGGLLVHPASGLFRDRLVAAEALVVMPC